MAIKVHFDSAGAPMPLRLILATKAGNKIRELPINTVKFKDDFANGTEISFEVHKGRCVDKNGAVDEAFWRRITDFKLAYCPEIDRWYELHVEINEKDETMKAVQAVSLGEAELSQINLYDIQINTEEDIAREDYEPTVLYNAENPNASLIDRMLQKAPHYRVAHVDDSIANIQRTFEFDDKSIRDACSEVAEEIGCLFMFDCIKGDDGKVDRTLSAYDLENYCESCGYRGDFTSQCEKCGSTSIRPGYGKNTTVFIARENLADDVVYKTDTDSVKNCFRLEAGDDLMTATVVNCNPNGSQYIWYISDDVMEDMSEELREKIADYNALYDDYQNTHSFSIPSALVSQYNTIVNKYISMNNELHTITSPIIGYPALMNAQYDTIDLQLYLNNSLMPNVEIASTDAQTEAAKLTTINLSPVAVAKLSSCTSETAANAVLGMAKCLVRDTYQVKVNDSSYNTSTNVWTGNFIVTNYGDEEDTATSATVQIVIDENLERYTRQKIDRAMHKESDDVTDISELFKLPRADFITELRKYSMQRLLSFRDACQAALDILIQQGVGEESHSLYVSLYLPYRQKAADIEAEIAVRTQELAVVAGVYDENGGIVSDGMQSVINTLRDEAKAALNFEAYLGEELWLEFASYRREDTFSNTNYISDGLDNAQLFTAAQEFVSVAQKEIYRSAMLQHSIDASLHSLLSMHEFADIVNDFEVGNWIRLKVDGKVYRLRLSSYELDYDRWAMSDVTFTDVKYGHSSASDISSLLDSLRSMQTSYGAVMRQAEQGEKTYSRMNNWASEGFSLTTKIVGGADGQEFIMDETGFTGRELTEETGEYSDEQIKIIANGIYVTDDGWETVRAGLGKFTFWNPETQQYETRFGVIADTVVSPIILSQNVGVYNQSGDVKIDENGITIIADETNNDTVFQILRRSAGGSLSSLLSIDANGNLVLSTYAPKSDTIKGVEVQYALGDDDETAPVTGWSSSTPQWTEGKYIWQRTKLTDGNNTVTYSSPVCIQGASGTSGIDGYNTAVVYLYKRSESAPTIDWTDTLVYTFATNTLSSVPSGWATTIPSGTNPVYMTAATASSQEATDSILYSEWASPVMIARNGTDGQPGSSGANTATVFLYQRAASAPTQKPSATLTYTFATGALSGGSLGDWSQNIPANNGYPCYFIQATAIGTSSTDTIAASEWSAVRELVADGTDGEDGKNTAIVNLYRRESMDRRASSPIDPEHPQLPPPAVLFLDGGDELFMRNLVVNLTPSTTGYTSTTVTHGGDGWDTQGYVPTTVSVDWEEQAGIVYGGTIDIVNGILTVTHIKEGQTVVKIADTYSQWQADTAYTVGTKVLYGGELYEVTEAHTSQEAHPPSDESTGLYAKIETDFTIEGIEMTTFGGVNRFTASAGGADMLIDLIYQADPTLLAVNIDWTDTLTYDFNTCSLTSVPDGWAINVPSGSDALYITSAVVSSNTSSGQIPYTSWSQPALISTGAVGFEETIKTEISINNESIVMSATNGDIYAIIEQTATGVTESYIATYSETVDGRFTTIGEDIGGINNNLENLYSQMTSVQGEIRRGWLEDPADSTKKILGIAISQKIDVYEDDAYTDEQTQEVFYKIKGKQTFGFYTSMGWQFYVNGVKVGWFDSGDSMLHVTNEVIEENLRIGNWDMTVSNGFGIRYTG